MRIPPAFPAALAAPFAAAAAQQLPTDFVTETVATGFTQPAGLAFLPDGRTLLIEQRTGLVKIVAAGAVGTVGRIPNVNAAAPERGLLGVAVDPRWPRPPYLYFYYSHATPQNLRLVRYTATGRLTDPTRTQLALQDPYFLLTDIPDDRGNHNGGTCRFGPDGMLYVSLGEDACPCCAQNNGDLRGVVLRLDVRRLPAGRGGPPAKSLLVPPGNPFRGPNANARLTWCYGLRNPFRIHLDPLTGLLYIGDPGSRRYEEINESRGGENFGWPWYEGPLRQTNCGGSVPTNLVPPIGGYDRSALPSAAILSWGRYRNRWGGGGTFGTRYEGDVFYGDYYAGFVRRLRWNGTRWTPAPPAPGQPNASDWATGFKFLADVLRGPDGALYYVQQFPGRLGRIRFVPRLPALQVNGTVKAGTLLPVRCRRDPGDFLLLALGTRTMPPTALPGFFGRLAIKPIPLVAGTANSRGTLDLTLPVPAGAAGLTVHFQCLAVAGGENYLSLPRTVRVVP